MFIKSTQRKTIDFLFSDSTKQSFVTELAALSNKFKSIFNIVNTMLDSNQELKDTYETFLKEYIITNDRYNCFLKYYPKLFKLIQDTYDTLNLGKDLTVKVNNEYDLNINFEETSCLYKVSIRTRFFLICYLSDYSVDQIGQKEIQKLICREMIDLGILDKLYRIINSIVLNTFPTKSGRKIWDLLSASTGYTADSYAIKLLSSVIYKALPSLKANENPIAYMISIAKNEVDWLLRTKLGVKFVNSEINIVTITEPNNHIEEHEIYYRTIVKEYFEPIANKYPELTNSLSKYNTFNTVANVCNPLINKIFGINSNHLLLENISIVNIFCYDFLTRFDPSKTELINFLLLIPISSRTYDNRVLPENYKEKIMNLVTYKELNKIFKHLSPSNIKKILIDSVTKLYGYTYITKDNVEVTIDWSRFIEQYIGFIYSISSGKYDEFIKIVKTEILQNRKDAA
jgi:hypothetical protein